MQWTQPARAVGPRAQRLAVGARAFVYRIQGDKKAREDQPLLHSGPVPLLDAATGHSLVCVTHLRAQVPEAQHSFPLHWLGFFFCLNTLISPDVGVLLRVLRGDVVFQVVGRHVHDLLVRVGAAQLVQPRTTHQTLAFAGHDWVPCPQVLLAIRVSVNHCGLTET